MDIKAIIGQFIDETGNFKLPAELSLAGLCETLFLMEKQAGIPDRPTLKYFNYATDQVETYTRAEVNRRIKAVAARLQQTGKVGDRVAILASNSPEYLFGFLGAMYAAQIPVPLYDPNEPGHADHLQAVLQDCKPTTILTNNASAAAVRKLFASIPGSERPRIISVSALPESVADSWQNPMANPELQQAVASGQMPAPVDNIAFLQYTSGSTRTPAGVMLTNKAIMSNVLQIYMAAHLKTPLRLVSWLPLHHDMGIILALFVSILGMDMDLFSPRDFIQNPKRWTEKLHSDPHDPRAVYTAVPNFALELAVRYGKPAAGEEWNYSNVDGVIIGSEPVTPKAVRAFQETFASCGLGDNVVRPSYGLAEASLLVSTPQTEVRPLIRWVDREQYSAGKVVPCEEGPNALALVSNGSVVKPQQLIIVDRETKQELPEGEVGEIWAYGDNLAAGYLGRPEETAETFHNKLAGRLAENSAAAGAPEDANWLATGDLGVMIDREVYITGRSKDLIVIAGRNHYPQDIEYTVDHASAHIRAAAIAAFAVPGDDVEQLVILAERDNGADAAGDEAAISEIRTAVSAAHGIVPADVVILAPDQIARSSAGKIARRVARQRYLDGQL